MLNVRSWVFPVTAEPVTVPTIVSGEPAHGHIATPQRGIAVSRREGYPVDGFRRVGFIVAILQRADGEDIGIGRDGGGRAPQDGRRCGAGGAQQEEGGQGKTAEDMEFHFYELFPLWFYDLAGVCLEGLPGMFHCRVSDIW